MLLRYGLFNELSRLRRSSTILFSTGFLLLPGVLSAADNTAETEHPFGESPANEPVPYEDQIDTHADGPSNPELMRRATLEPESFTGKQTMLNDGRMIGPIIAVRRSLQDQQLYLIIDATTFFNSPTEYAVPAEDMHSMQDDTLMIAEYTGMHLRGMEYYEEDYEDIDTGANP